MGFSLVRTYRLVGVFRNAKKKKSEDIEQLKKDFYFYDEVLL